MTAIAPTVYVLDFDGVVCEGLDECLLIAWIAFEALPKEDWDVRLLDTIPVPFRQKFANDRNFVRHDGHFLVPFVSNDLFRSGPDFEAFYARLAETTRTGFRDRFRQVRTHIRQADYAAWLGLHRLYDPMLAALKRMQAFRIVSGKDADSIAAILAANGIIVPPDHIFGGQSSKVSTLLHLKQQADAHRQRMIFCDDNLANAIEAQAAGIDTLWARWGYHTDADSAEAERLGMQGIGLDDIETSFPSSPVGRASNRKGS